MTHSSQSKARSGTFLAQRVDQAVPDFAITWSYLDSSIPQLGDELQPLFKELLLGRGHQHLCLRCPDLFLRGLERGQDSKDAMDIHRHLRPYEQDGSPPQAHQFSREEDQAQWDEQHKLRRVREAPQTPSWSRISSSAVVPRWGLDTASLLPCRCAQTGGCAANEQFPCQLLPRDCSSAPKGLPDICSKQLQSSKHSRS